MRGFDNVFLKFGNLTSLNDITQTLSAFIKFHLGTIVTFLIIATSIEGVVRYCSRSKIALDVFHRV